MIRLAETAVALALFLLLFVGLRAGITVALDRHSLKRKLGSYRESAWSEAVSGWLSRRFATPFRHVADLLLALGWPLSPGGFGIVSCASGLLGVASGVLVFQSFRAVAILVVMLGGLPYLWLRMALINRQMATRLEFLPAAELFYQCYLVTGSRQIRTALRRTVEERRLSGEVQAAFEQLYRNLSLKGDDEGSLRRFSLSFGHAWADYFCSILKVSLEEGHNVADNLRELVSDMRKSQLANHAERHRLLEIRLANFTPVLFLALFMGINFRLNPDGSSYYYFVDPGGRGMLLNAVVLLFGSMIMGLFLSRRKL